MKSVKCILTVALLVSAFAVTGVSAKRKMVPRVYMFGLSASFTDSIVYFTNIQPVDSAWIETKKNFLLGRDNYSYQLRDYFANEQQMPHRTCIVISGEKRKDVEKKLLKLRRMYTVKAKGMYDVRTLGDSDFKFKAINMDIQEYDEQTAEAEKQKKEKKKKQKKQ